MKPGCTSQLIHVWVTRSRRSPIYAPVTINTKPRIILLRVSATNVNIELRN